MVTVADDRHPFQEGDMVTFSDVRGMTELNGCEPRRVHVLGNQQFTIGDTSSFSPYESFGWCIQVKQPRSMHFLPLQEANKCPGEFLVTDFGKFDHAVSLHVAVLALDQFMETMGRPPCPWSDGDASQLVSLSEQISEQYQVSEMDSIEV